MNKHRSEVITTIQKFLRRKRKGKQLAKIIIERERNESKKKDEKINYHEKK